MHRYARLLLPLTLLCFLIGGFFSHPHIALCEDNINEEQSMERYEEAVVLEVRETEKKDLSSFSSQMITQEVKVRILTGAYQGQELTAENTLSGSAGMDVNIKAGDQIVLCMIMELGPDGKERVQNVYVSDRVRSPAIGWLVLLFSGLLLIFGRLQGLKALFALGATILGIYKVLLPGLMAGKSPLPLTIAVLIGVTLVTMVFVAGFSRKSLAAFLGTMGGLLAAGWLATVFGDWAYLAGLGTEEERMLLYVEGVTLDLRGILFSGILIGALGAIMDVAMSVASTVSELKRADPQMKTWQLIGAGMNVGRDIMGTMANTLILAYTGSALPLMLLFMVYEMEPVRIINWEMIATEIVRALVGSIAFIISIPITALAAGWLNNLPAPLKLSRSDASCEE